jgi:hypothetical protein
MPQILLLVLAIEVKHKLLGAQTMLDTAQILDTVSAGY